MKSSVSIRCYYSTGQLHNLWVSCGDPRGQLNGKPRSGGEAGLPQATMPPQWDTTTHLLEWPKSTPNASKDVEQQKPTFMAGGNTDGYSPFGRHLGSFSETHSYHVIQQSCFLVFTQESWKHMPTQNPAHRWLQQTRKQPRRPSVGGRINSSPSTQGILFTTKKKWLLDHEKTGKK